MFPRCWSSLRALSDLGARARAGGPCFEYAFFYPVHSQETLRTGAQRPSTMQSHVYISISDTSDNFEIFLIWIFLIWNGRLT